MNTLGGDEIRYVREVRVALFHNHQKDVFGIRKNRFRVEGGDGVEGVRKDRIAQIQISTIGVMRSVRFARIRRRSEVFDQSLQFGRSEFLNCGILEQLVKRECCDAVEGCGTEDVALRNGECVVSHRELVDLRANGLHLQIGPREFN